MDLSFILLNISSEIYSIPKKSKYTAVFLSKNNEIQCVYLLCLQWRLMTFTSSFVLDKSSLEKTPLNLGL